MTKKVEEANRVRKEYSPRGQRSQKRVTFLCDFENLEILDRQTNKGRFLNQLIQENEQKKGGR